MVMECEVDRQSGCQSGPQLTGTNHSVIAIDPQPFRGLEPDHDQQGGECPTPQPETGMPFAYIVEQGGHDHIGVRDPVRYDGEGSVVTVTLVDVRLVEEQLLQLRAEPRSNGGALRAVQ